MGSKNNKKKQSRREKTMLRYNESTSWKLQRLWDSLNNKYRNETNEERYERLLSHDMTFPTAVGIENELTAREINESNRMRPVRTIYKERGEDFIKTNYELVDEVLTEEPVIEQQQESPFPNGTPISPESDHRGWVLLDNTTVVPESHPLWLSRETMIMKHYVAQSPDLIVDQYGFSRELARSIRRQPEDWRRDIKQGTSRNQKRPGHHSDAERILLATQVSLSLSLQNINTIPAAVTDVCIRLGLYREEANETEWRTRISHSVRGWMTKYNIKMEIRPVPKKKGTLSQEDRRLLRQDFDLFKSYGFSKEHSATLGNKIHGTNRLAATIRGWFVDGTPKIKNKTANGVTNGNTPEVAMTNEPKESPVMDPRTAKWGIPAVQAGEVCPNCITTCAECGHSQNSVHCADKLTDVGYGYIKMVRLSMESEANHIKMGSAMHQEVRDEVYNTVIDDIRDEVKGDLETENTSLKETMSKQ